LRAEDETSTPTEERVTSLKAGLRPNGWHPAPRHLGSGFEGVTGLRDFEEYQQKVSKGPHSDFRDGLALFQVMSLSAVMTHSHRAWACHRALDSSPGPVSRGLLGFIPPAPKELETLARGPRSVMQLSAQRGQKGPDVVLRTK